MASHTQSTPATNALTRAGIAFTGHAYVHDERAESYGLEAAAALGIEAARVFKTLMVDADGTLCVAVIPVTCRLDLKAVAAAVGAKRARMADPAAAERATGYVVGGIAPVGQKRPHRTVIDASASAWESIFVSGGRRGFDVELAPADLQAVTGALMTSIGR